MTEAKNFSPHRIVKKALEGLKKNETKVISGRFGINESRKTLSAIGSELGLSRERIRQIEKESMKRLAASIVESENNSIQELISSFEKGGGIVSHGSIANKLLDSSMKDSAIEFNSLHLILSLLPQIRRIEKTRELESSWILASIDKESVVTVIDSWVKHLEKTKKPSSLEVLVKEHPDQSKYEITFLSELPHISKKLVKTESGHIGLSAWPEVNPKNVKDKIYYVLKKEGKPLHFDLIAKKINEQNFSKKTVVRATVHNELIADQRFVLIGRGIYALTEWGYKPGTVYDIIKNILIEKKHMAVEDIVKEVSKQRSVKRNTILINLQTKKEFQRVGKDMYALSK